MIDKKVIMNWMSFTLSISNQIDKMGSELGLIREMEYNQFDICSEQPKNK